MATANPYQKVIQEGIWLYDQVAQKPVYIIEQNYDYWFEMGKADGNLEQGEAPKLNANGIIYYVKLNAIDGSGPWSVDSFGHASIDDAKMWAEAKLQQNVRWLAN